MRSAAILVLPLLLAGCDVHSKNPASGDGNVSISADDSGHIAFNLPIVEGQIKVPGPLMHEGEFDMDGVKLMPGSSITGFSMFAADKGATVNMRFSAPAPPDAVRAYFRDQFGKQGVKVALAGDAVTGTTRDGNPFSIRVTPASNGSTGMIEIQDRD